MHHEDIKAAIRKKGVTPAFIADTLGVSRALVSAVIRGKARSVRIAQAIASVVELSIDALWPGAYGQPAAPDKTVTALITRAGAKRSAGRTARRAA